MVICRWVERFVVLLAALIGAVGMSQAAVYTYSGFTWDSANSFTAASGSINQANSAVWSPAILVGEELLSFGRLTAGGTGLRRATLGDAGNSNSIRNAVTLTFPAGLFLPNGAGDDLVVYEQGNANEPEGYAIAVRKAGDAMFTNFRYEIWDSQQVGGSPAAAQIATGFDLTDFGFAAGEQIDAIVIENLRLFNAGVNSVVDYVPVSGSGFVLTVTGGGPAPVGYAVPIGYGANKDQAIPTSEFDPDISYVGVLHTLTAAVPEAGSFLFVGAALVAATFTRHVKRLA